MWGADQRRWLAATVVAVVLFVLVGASADNAARPSLAPSGWAPGLWLPFALSPAAVTGCLWAAYLIGGIGTYAALRAAPRGRLASLPWWPIVALGLLVLVTQPFGSADHVNYAAYGRIWVDSGDPYTQSPIAWAGGTDPVTSRVESPWTTAPSVYGPVATLLQGLTAVLDGDNLRQVVWCWQVVCVLAWLATRWLLRRLTDDHARVEVLWTLNPLVLGLGVFGAHVDLVAVPFAVAAIVLVGRSPAAAGMLAGLAAATKVTYAAVLAGLVLAWWLHERPRFARRLALGLGAALVTLAVVHLPFGRHTYDQLLAVRRSVSLATPWRLLLDGLSGTFGSPAMRTVISIGAAVLALALAGLLWRLTEGLAHGSPQGVVVRVTLVLTTAYTLAAPYSLPWYDMLTWALLPVLAASVLDAVLLARGVVMAWAYVPGRVLGMTPGVERVTLGFRRYVAPYVNLAVWLGLGALAARATPRGRRPRAGRPRGRRPRGSAPTSR